MPQLRVNVPDSTGEYTTMGASYERIGMDKDATTTLTFEDIHGWRGGELVFDGPYGETYGPYDFSKLTLTIRGGYEVHDIIKLFRRVVKHHDMQMLLIYGLKPEEE